MAECTYIRCHLSVRTDVGYGRWVVDTEKGWGISRTSFEGWRSRTRDAPWLRMRDTYVPRAWLHLQPITKHVPRASSYREYAPQYYASVHQNYTQHLYISAVTTAAGCRRACFMNPNKNDTNSRLLHLTYLVYQHQIQPFNSSRSVDERNLRRRE